MKFRLLLILLVPVLTFAQTPGTDKYRVKLKSGSYTPSEEKFEQPKASKSSSTSRVSGGTYKLIQFHEMPTLQEKENLKKSGINLVEYVPNLAFFAYLSNSNTINYSSFKIRAIEDINFHSKIDPSLKAKTLPYWAVREGGKVELVAKIFKNAELASVAAKLKEIGVVVLKESKNIGQIQIKALKGKIEEIAKIEEISFVYPIAPPFKSHTTDSKMSHTLNVLNSNINMGRNLNGHGVVVGVGDGGYIDFHHDFQKRLSNLDEKYSTSAYHSTHVMGIVGGAGNIREEISGAANKATLLNFSFDNVILNSPHYYAKKNMVVTNNSYGFNAGQFGAYDYSSSLIDKQLTELPHVLHIFSAGNDYDYATVHSGYNSAKNVLTVGSIDRRDLIADYSSKGPVNDGRLKPELVAMGTDIVSTYPGNNYQALSGTSMAAPVVSSAAALLYERYKQINNGSNPSSALIKAVLCNSAEDLGPAGPDYVFGYGKMNARRAVETLEAKRYFAESVSQSTNKTFTVNVPAGTKQLKVMLYWHDIEAADNAADALVNNLELSVNNGTQSWLPWVVNPFDISAPAVRMKDIRNNIEQVTIDNPKAGSYTLKVDGAIVPYGVPQNFVVTYEIVKPELTLTYPLGGESLLPGEEIDIKWDNYTETPVTTQYSTDNGASWITIKENIPASQSYFAWTVPAVIKKALIRVKNNSFSSQSQPFNIMPAPSNLSLSQRFSQSVTLSWDKVEGATSYQIFLLSPDDSEMKSMGTTTALSYTFGNLDKSASYLFSVKAIQGSISSRRAPALRQEVNPPMLTIAYPSENQKFNACEPVKIVASVNRNHSNLKAEFFLKGEKIAEDDKFPYEAVVNYSPGKYEISVVITTEFGASSSKNISFEILSPTSMPLPYVNDFNNSTDGWHTSLDNNSIWKWGLVEGSDIKPLENGGKGWSVNLNDSIKSLKEYSIVSPSFNFRDVKGPVQLSFKQNLSLSENEGIFVEMSNNCGITWIPLGSRISDGVNWYDATIPYMYPWYLDEKDAWSDAVTGWREVKHIVPAYQYTHSDIQFKISYYATQPKDFLFGGAAIDDFKVEEVLQKSISEQDSLALVDLYQATDGNNWKINTNWFITDVKDWYGVEVVDGRVASLALVDNNLSGELPETIGDLEELKYLGLHYNNLIGNIPASIGKLKKLKNLILEKNNLSGQIPKELFNATNLYQLVVDHNNLSGSIPEEIGNLKKLEWLFFSFNKISGSIPESVNNCTKLQSFGFQNNRIENLPKFFYNSNPITIYAAENRLTFEDIEPNIFYLWSSNSYSPQDSIGVTKTVQIFANSAFKLTANYAGNSSNNRYTWYRDGNVVATDLTTPFYDIKNLPAGTNSQFYCKVTNTAVPDLELWTRPTTVRAKNPVHLYRVDVGSEETVPALPIAWERDSKNNPSPYFVDYSDTQTEGNCWWLGHVNKTNIPNCIFGSFRFAWTEKGLNYEFPVENGKYLVNLYFAEKDNTIWRGPQAPGDHLINVLCEGEKKLVNFDAFAEKGYNAIKKNFYVNISDGKLSLAIKAIKGNAFINGIEIIGAPQSAASNAENFEEKVVKHETLEVYPNPIIGNSFTVSLKELASKNSHFVIIDHAGKSCFTTNSTFDNNGLAIVNITNGNLLSGIYFLRVSTTDGSVKTLKLIKE